MSIPNNILTPGIYTDVNINTQRAGLPANIHKIVFITNDEQPQLENGNAMPVDIYDKAEADAVFGNGEVPSEAGRMITAAIKTNRMVDVQILGKLTPPAE